MIIIQKETDKTTEKVNSEWYINTISTSFETLSKAKTFTLSYKTCAYQSELEVIFCELGQI